MGNDKKLLKIYKEVAKKHGLTLQEVKAINESQFKFMRETIRGIDFKTMEESNWEEYKTNFNLKYLGKLYVNPFRIFKINQKKNGTTKLK